METTGENDLIEALGMTPQDEAKANSDDNAGLEEGYEVVPDPDSEAVDLSELRGVNKAGEKNPDHDSDTELEGLAELVPDVKARRRQTNESGASMNTDSHAQDSTMRDALDLAVAQEMEHAAGGEETDQAGEIPTLDEKQKRKMSMLSATESTNARRLSMQSATENVAHGNDSMRVHKNKGDKLEAVPSGDGSEQDVYQAEDEASSQNEPQEDDSFDEFPGSDGALDDLRVDSDKVPKEFINMSSGQSVSTATQTQEVRMPMYLPTFKPATGCTNASDFIVRCFVARLRSGITVVKHGRSRWCKSRLRVLHIHPDGRSLSWKPAEGEPTSSKRPPKLDLSTCLEVRHAWSPDPQNPMYTGTSILRQKCEAANAHKSFALIFKQRTVDITAVTADQCKVLMEGFSALCFRLQVANLAGRGAKKGPARPMPEEDGVSVTASATLTNTSTPRAR
jgi:hypothetical protein